MTLFKYASDDPLTKYCLIGFRYACRRRWFGLRTCFAGDPRVMWNEKDWGGLARRRAAQAWNNAVERHHSRAA